MSLRVKIVLLLMLGALANYAQPIILGVTNGASYSGNLAPGTWAAIFGTQLASAAVVAETVPLPKQLNDVSVTIGGLAAPLRFISPGQINVVIPFELNVPAAGTVTPVVVATAAGTSPAFNVLLSRNSPGLFTRDASAAGNAWVFDPNFTPVTAIGTDPIVLYASGLGPTNPPAASDSGGASTEPLNRMIDNLSVFVGDRQADILFAGLAPGFPGIYQLNLLPHGAATDRIYMKVNGWQSNIATVPLTAGANVANVTGSIDGLYPSTLPALGPTPTAGPIAFSVMLMAATFTVDFDILPNAMPFSVVATCEAGTAVFDIDPVQGTYQVTRTSPTPKAEIGDFRGTEFSAILDFTTCGPSGGCSPFPGDAIPTARLDPMAAKAYQFLPAPTSAAGGANATSSGSGTLSGTHFSRQSITFGGFIQIPHAGPSPRTTTFRLYVDGRLIASKDVNYPVL